MAATMWPAAGGGSAEAFADSGDEEEFPPYCEQPPPSQMPGYGGFLQSQFQQDGGSPAAGDDHAGPGLSQLPAGGGSHEEQGSEGEDGEEDAGVSQEGGSGLEAAAQRAQRGASPGERRGEHSTGLTPGLTQLPAWAFGRPASPAPLGSLLAGRECLAVLPDTPAQLTFSVHALLNVRGDPATRPPLPDGQLPPDQDSSQFTGIIDDLFQSQPPPQVPTDMLFSMAADAGEGYYLFRSAAQAQVDKLWALAQQLAGRLADTTAALEQQRAEEQERAGLPAPEAEAVVELRDALLEVKQQLEAARAEKEQLLTATQGKLQQASDAAAQREAELQQQLEQASEAAAEREAELQQQLQQACKAAAEQEAKLRQQLQQASEAAAEREAELQLLLQQACKEAAEQETKQQQLEQASEAAAEREAELQQQLQQACKEETKQQQLEQASEAAAEREAELLQQLKQACEEAAEQETKQQQLEQAGKAAAEREAELRQQLQQASEAAAEQEAKLRQLQQAREAAAERKARLRQQLKQAGKAAAAREAELQQQLKHAGKAAAEREAELLQQLEQACEEAAEREAELQQELQHAQQQAEGEGAECRQLRQQLADLQRTRQQELAEADEQQEAAAAEQQRLRNEARRWEARCQAVQQQAAAAGGEQMAAERDAAVTKCRQLQQELAVALRRAADLQEQNAGLQAASAAVLAQEAQAAACVGCMPSSAVPTPEPQVAWRQLSRGEEQELKLLLTDTNYQHAKLGAAFRPLQALRSPKFWQGAAERLQAPEELVQQEGARLLAEVAMAGQRTVEAALREARRSQRTALRQARRMKAVVEGVRREAAERQAAAEQGAGGAARCGKRKQEPQGGYDLWELLVDLSQLEEELLEAQNELDQEREASSCKAWQLLEEEAAQRDAACQRVRQLEAQLEESWELVHQLREQAQLWCLEAQPAAKRARCTAAEPAGGLVLAASDGWEGPPADSEAGEGATWRTAQKQAAEQRHLADQAPESLANTTSQLQPAARSVGQKAEPAAAAAQLHHDGQPDSASMPAGGSEWAPAAASSSTHIQPLLQQGQPAGWQDFMTPQLIAEHRAFAPLMAQALFNDFVKSQQGSRGGARPNGGSKKRRRKAAVP